MNLDEALELDTVTFACSRGTLIEAVHVLADEVLRLTSHRCDNPDGAA
jgi:hypothetical protein